MLDAEYEMVDEMYYNGEDNAIDNFFYGKNDNFNLNEKSTSTRT